MKRTLLWIVLVVVLAAASFGGGYALANFRFSTLSSQAQTTSPLYPYPGWPGWKWDWDDYGPLHTYLLQAFAEKTGLSVDQVNAQLATGKTLAQIALDQGVKQEDLSTFLLEVHKLALDKAVAAGAITQQQADWMYQRLQQGKLWWGPGRGCPMCGDPGWGRGRGWGRWKGPRWNYPYP